MVDAPSLPAALHYLEQSGVVREWSGGMKRSSHGYSFYFTVIVHGRHFANLMKVCESRHGRVTGATNMSAGEPDCEQ